MQPSLPPVTGQSTEPLGGRLFRSTILESSQGPDLEELSLRTRPAISAFAPPKIQLQKQIPVSPDRRAIGEGIAGQ